MQIDEKLQQDLLRYMFDRPYREVHDLIARLVIAGQAQIVQPETVKTAKEK